MKFVLILVKMHNWKSPVALKEEGMPVLNSTTLQVSILILNSRIQVK